MSFTNDFEKCIQSIRTSLTDVCITGNTCASTEQAATARRSIEFAPLDLTPSVHVSINYDLFLGIYNDSNDLIEFDVILGVNTVSKMFCTPHSFTPALENKTFVPLVALAYHRTNLQLLSSVPEQKADCFLAYGFLPQEIRMELMNDGWKVFSNDGQTTIYGHRGTAGFDPQNLAYIAEEEQTATFRELPNLKRIVW